MDTNSNITVKKLPVTALVEKYDLTNLTPEIDLSERYVQDPGLTRPALQLAGFYDYFNYDRVLIIGNAEYEYIKTLDPAVARERYDKLTSYHSPCIIYARGLEPDMGMIAACHRNEVPLFTAPAMTNVVISELTRYLGVELAPTQIVHGVLLDVYGEGVLITGDSGIGKSETALELIKRGHRLIADDAVEIRRTSRNSLEGRSPAIIQYFMELRGIGVINVQQVYGIGSVKPACPIDCVVNLELWDNDRRYDRLGIESETTEFLGVTLPKITIPVRPGRNLAVILELAAMTNRQKKSGYSAAEELAHRIDTNVDEGVNY